ncbi:MAG TPA: hypothetical protein VHZ97_04365 [Pseudonocardiaceae bacterium]|nr:hypothetical protein [Pseudonocardiaceae bacterium]
MDEDNENTDPTKRQKDNRREYPHRRHVHGHAAAEQLAETLHPTRYFALHKGGTQDRTGVDHGRRRRGRQQGNPKTDDNRDYRRDIGHQVIGPTERGKRPQFPVANSQWDAA